ncbi:MAG TPA: MFS transporter [Gaiellaceae bacterium]|nr:MFS transporter [Gaiellaceae bacterium]
MTAPISIPTAPTRVVTPQFALVLGATFAVFAALGLLLVALPLYVRDELGRSDLAVGITMGVASIGAILAGPVAGRVADRRGRRIVILISIAVMFGGYLFLAAEPPLAAIVPVRLVVGAAEAAFVVAAYTMATDLTPSDRQGEGMSLITVGSYLGLALGPLAGDLAVGDGRFAHAWLIAAAAAVVAAALALAVRETRPVFDQTPPAGWLPPRSALLPGLVLLLALIGFGGFNAFAALHAREIGLERPGLVFLLFAAVVILVRVVGRKLPDRLGPQAAASFACAAVAGGLVVVAGWQTEAGLFLGTAIFAVGQAFAYPAISVLAMARSSAAERSAAVGAVIAFVDVALASGAFVLGIAAELAGYPAVFAAGALSAGLGLVLVTLTAGRATAATRPA